MTIFQFGFLIFVFNWLDHHVNCAISQSNDLDCDFEGRLRCAWRNGTNGLEDNFDWLAATQVITDGFHSIPRSKDGNNDVFLYVKGSSKLRHSDTALLIGDTVPCQEGAGVFSFYVWKTSHFPSLELCIRKPPGENGDLSCIHKIYGMHRQEWVFKEYEIPADHESFDIVFRAAFRSHVDIIGLDEVVYNARICRSNPTKARDTHAVPQYALRHFNQHLQVRERPEKPNYHPTKYSSLTGGQVGRRFHSRGRRNTNEQKTAQALQNDWYRTVKVSDRVFVTVKDNNTIFMKSLKTNQSITAPISPEYLERALKIEKPFNTTIEISDGLIRLAPEGVSLGFTNETQKLAQPPLVIDTSVQGNPLPNPTDLSYLWQFLPTALDTVFGSSQTSGAGALVSGLLGIRRRPETLAPNLFPRQSPFGPRQSPIGPRQSPFGPRQSGIFPQSALNPNRLLNQFGIPSSLTSFLEPGVTSITQGEQTETTSSGGTGGSTGTTPLTGTDNGTRQCSKVNCDFDSAGFCNYVQGSASSQSAQAAAWKLSDRKIANSLTGIFKDVSGSGQYTYSGGVNPTRSDLYVLESPAFSTTQDTRLFYSIYQAGAEGRFRVCIDDEFNCIAEHNGKDVTVNSRRWVSNNIRVPQGSNMKLLFVADQLQKNYVIGLDSLGLMKLDGTSFAFCT